MKEEDSEIACSFVQLAADLTRLVIVQDNLFSSTKHLKHGSCERRIFTAKHGGAASARVCCSHIEAELETCPPDPLRQCGLPEVPPRSQFPGNAINLWQTDLKAQPQQTADHCTSDSIAAAQEI